MDVELIALKFNRFGKEQTNFKIINKNYCCGRMKDLLNKKKIIPVKIESSINVSKDQSISKDTFTYALNFLEEDNLFPIDVCPFCGKENSSIIKEEKDVSQEVNSLQKELKALTNKLKCYPNSTHEELTKQISDINNQLNYYYYIE